MAAVLEGIQQETAIEVLPEDSHPSADGPPQELALTKEEGDEEEVETPTRGVKFSIADVVEGLPPTDSEQSQSKLMAPVKRKNNLLRDNCMILSLQPSPCAFTRVLKSRLSQYSSVLVSSQLLGR